MKKFAKSNHNAYKLGLKAACFGALFAFLTTLLFNGLFSIIVYYGSILAKDGKITVGQITAFMLYMIQLVFNFAIIAGVFTNLFKMSGASQKIVEMMKIVP